MKLLTRTTTTPELPPLDPSTVSLRRDPEYCAADAKLQALRGDLSGLEREIDAVAAARARQITASQALNARAEALLAGRPEPEAAPSSSQLADLHDRRILLRAAIEIQERRVSDERDRVSRAIIETARPHYRRLIQRLAAALTEVAAIQAEEEGFRQALLDADIAGVATLPASPFLQAKLGRLDDPMGNFNLWLDYGREHGLL